MTLSTSGQQNEKGKRSLNHHVNLLGYQVMSCGISIMQPQHSILLVAEEEESKLGPTYSSYVHLTSFVWLLFKCFETSKS